MKNFMLCVASAAILSGCAELADRDRNNLEGWRASTILGGGDGRTAARSEGRIVSGQVVEAGNGTIYPGRQSLFRDSDFVNSTGERTVSLNLVDVSIAEAAAAILGELLRENYVLDPAVTGTVNIRSSQPISRTTAIEVFELALKQNNAALVRRGDSFAIVPLSGELSIGASVTREVPIGYSLRVIPLRHIGAQEMATILQPFAGGNIVGVDAQRNIIVLAGTSADQRAWQETVTSFDVDWLANRSVGVFPIRGRSAQSIVNGLDLVVETDANFEPIVVFEVIPENNSILAVAKTPSALQNVSTWIRRLTQEGQNDAQVYSYDMKYARASDIAPTLAQILGVQVETADSGTANTESADFVNASFSGDQNATRIVASEATNTLLIHATNDEYQRVLGMLHRLDVPPRQVLVEATIVEVSLNDELRYGVQYFFENNGNTGALTRSSTDLSIGSEVPGFSAVFGGATPEVIVDALEDVTSVNVVSSPNLMILNNESARLVVGDQVPISVQTATDATDDSDVFVSTVEFRDTGVIFEVTPRINSSGSVVLDIQQEVSTIGETDGSTGNPIISQRTISSAIAVDSGETIALGGLFEQRSTNGTSGLPGLARQPIWGGLFGRQSRTDSQTELLVLITPRIVNSNVDTRRITRNLRERMQNIRLDDATLSNTINTPSMATANSADIASRRATQTRNASAQGDVLAAVQTAVQAQPATTGTHFTYFGAFSNEQAARAHWSELLASNGSDLAGLQPRFTNDNGTISVAVGPMDASRASQLCVTIRSDCFSTGG
ncbi:type II secretion system protein D (GspD) [Yoonia maricola]|uniref:Type II secretion system protein D (GspD) n=1 Tax=Yoonia maricola TaxID=420999 RepID=A0A2M8W1Z1_9RHOB|nr:type II secretion system secretin GspD [Yoonia maricola]PJI84929.1 type II secretion system protein D (GspD) [Yoonia maricola]